MKRVYLLTGRPGTGKTSLVKEVVARMGSQAGGFYTEEIREGGTRRGFRLVTLDGEQAVLAHINIHSSFRVSRYGVDIESLERVGVIAIEKATQHAALVVIDEIGKMELFSGRFRDAVIRAVDSGKKVLGTIMLSANEWADTIKSRPEVSLITLTRDNRQRVMNELRQWLETPDQLKNHHGSPR